MLTLVQTRGIALSLPEAAEQDHFGRPSFRVRGKIFATVPDPDHLNVMLTPEDIEGAVAEDPASCEKLFWGGSLRCVRVDLRTADPIIVTELLTDAWRRKAPRQLSGDVDHQAGRALQR